MIDTQLKIIWLSDKKERSYEAIWNPVKPEYCGNHRNFFYINLLYIYIFLTVHILVAQMFFFGNVCEKFTGWNNSNLASVFWGIKSLFKNHIRNINCNSKITWLITFIYNFNTNCHCFNNKKGQKYIQSRVRYRLTASLLWYFMLVLNETI